LPRQAYIKRQISATGLHGSKHRRWTTGVKVAEHTTTSNRCAVRVEYVRRITDDVLWQHYFMLDVTHSRPVHNIQRLHFARYH